MKNPQKRRKKWCVGPEKVVRKPWGRPLVSYQVIVNLIGATTTQASGLHYQADLDTDVYPTKVRVTDKQLATVALHPHRFHGDWNYTIQAPDN